MTSNSLLKQVNNAVLDLQGVIYQTYAGNIKVLGKLLRHHDLKAFNDKLTSGLDLDSLLNGNPRTRGSMIGSGVVEWPEDNEQALGMKLLLIWKFAEEPEFMLHFSHDFYHTGNNFNGNLRAIIGQMIVPFARDYKDYVLLGASAEVKLIVPLSTKVFVVPWA